MLDVSSSVVKAGRARELLEQLKAAREEVVRANFMNVVFHRDGRDVVALLHYFAPMPTQLSCIVGDVVHNLRTALDHLACAAVEQGGGTVTRRTQFPVNETQDAFHKAVFRGEQLKGAPSAFIAFVESLQPYHSAVPSENLLHVIHRLDIRDKHRQLLVAAVLPARVQLDVHGPPGCITTLKFPTELPFPLAEGEELVRFSLALGFEIDRPPLSIALHQDVALVEEPPIHSRPIVPAMYELVDFALLNIIVPAGQVPI